MGKARSLAAVQNIIYGVFFVLVCSCCGLSEPGVIVEEEVAEAEVSSVVLEASPVIEKQFPLLEIVYLSQLGVREKTGKNDGPEVEMYLKATGLGKGNPWCAAFVRWCFDESGTKTTITAWSPTAENKKNLVFKNRDFYKEPQSGDVFTLYYNSLKRVGHTGFFHRKVNSSIYESVEGNTNAEGSREGDGVYMKKRSYNATHSISRWQ